MKRIWHADVRAAAHLIPFGSARCSVGCRLGLPPAALLLAHGLLPACASVLQQRRVLLVQVTMTWTA